MLVSSFENCIKYRAELQNKADYGVFKATDRNFEGVFECNCRYKARIHSHFRFLSWDNWLLTLWSQNQLWSSTFHVYVTKLYLTIWEMLLSRQSIMLTEIKVTNAFLTAQNLHPKSWNFSPRSKSLSERVGQNFARVSAMTKTQS